MTNFLISIRLKTKFLIFLSIFGFIMIHSSLFALSGGDAAGQIPIPAKDFAAVITDSKGVETKISKLTWNGKIFIEGHRGLSRVTVNFDNIKEIDVKTATLDTQNRVEAEIGLKNGENHVILIDAGSTLAGETSFGSSKFFFKDISTLKLQSP